MPCPTFDIPQPPCNGKAARCHWGKVFFTLRLEWMEAVLKMKWEICAPIFGEWM